MHPDEIKLAADKFREEHWGTEIPVDIEKIIDFKLGIDVVPISGLRSQCDTDALIASNWQQIYVDNGHYTDDRYQSRIRFSLAHEIGHFVLHKALWEKLGIKSISDFYKVYDVFPEGDYSIIESQANKFAGHLLVPRSVLAIHRDNLLKSKPTLTSGIEKKSLIMYISIPLAKIFDVSEKTLEISLNDLDWDLS